jgi:hypothetical protein
MDAERVQEIVAEFERKVADAGAKAYVQLYDLGLEDAQIVALLGLPDDLAETAA